MDATGARRRLRPPPADRRQAEQDDLLRQAVRIYKLRTHMYEDFEALASGFLSFLASPAGAAIVNAVGAVRQFARDGATRAGVTSSAWRKQWPQTD
jgi:hypothetical protein